MAGGKRVGAELACRLEEVGELDRLVARDAGDRGLARGVVLLKGARANAIERDAEVVRVKCEDGRVVEGSHALLAVGSIPNSDGLGLDKLAPGVPQSSAPAAPPAPVQPPPPPVAAKPPAKPVETGPLHEVFEEFRAELGEMGAGEEEDLETHYNLGIAFREMGLLEEAISEFQKVAKASDKGKAFRYAMQCCTLLGLAFMEKGQPNIAAIWYERALHTPGVDAERGH